MQGLRFAVLMDFTFSDYQSNLRWGIERYTRQNDIRTVYFGIGNLNPDSPDAFARERLFELIQPSEFDGILLASSTLMNSRSLDTLRFRLQPFAGLPMVTIGPAVGSEDSVRVDGKAGMRDLLVHMLGQHGYRDIAFISGPFANPEALERLEVFKSCLAEFGIPYDPRRVYEGNFRQSCGATAVKVFYEERGIRPQAILCASDFMAIGVWKALRGRGLSIPQDVALSGFDDLQVSYMISHQFTTVRQPFEEQAWQAASRLHGIVSGKGHGPPTVLPSELRIRTSCGCLEPNRRQRKGAAVTSAERCAELSRRLGLHASAGLTSLETSSLCQDWVKIVNQALDERRTTYELEVMLMSLREAEGNANDPEMDALLATFHALSLEECGQAQVLNDIFESALMSNLRITIDKLQDTLMRSRDDTGQEALMGVLAEQCRSKVFQAALFEDVLKFEAGTRVAYNMSGMPWTPGPGHWLPRYGENVVVNALIAGSSLLGILVMSADIENVAIYDYVSTRLASLYHDGRMMRDAQELNRRMKDEIKAREESQRLLTEALAQVERLSVEDELTHLRNRRGFLTLAEQQIKMLRRQGGRFIIMFADVDGLKAINDLYGHKEGDTAIKAAAESLKRALRETDILARIGGDEFTALICEADGMNAEGIGKRIGRQIDAANAELHAPWTLSLSVGFFTATQGNEKDVNWMLEQADAELYRRKQERKRGQK